jgi:hypothetical protein
MKSQKGKTRNQDTALKPLGRSPIKGVVISMNVLVPDDALRLTVSSKVYPMLYALPACLQVRSRANCVGGCDLLVDKGGGERRGTGVFVREGFDRGGIIAI